ncbi:hypothetical protein P4H46_12990 [Paenibacillus glucanolyticus]|uniref:hypothetical protein n=1 Tax=Paenibacillus glucanolyticus TaxID=59843 RepID=UPI0030C96C4F
MFRTRWVYVIITLSMILASPPVATTSRAQGRWQDAGIINSQQPPPEGEDVKHRLERLEPSKPQTIMEWPEDIIDDSFYPKDIIPISEVLQKGTAVPFIILKNDPDFRRPVYEEHWHSTYWGGRWSYMPMRIHYALHRLYTTYDIGISSELDFKQNVGIEFPVFQNRTDLDLYIVVFQTTVTHVYTHGNQIVLSGKPTRDGVQVISIKTSALRPFDLNKKLLVQLATAQGHELDYSLIVYEPPDFWIKQIQPKDSEYNR